MVTKFFQEKFFFKIFILDTGYIYDPCNFPREYPHFSTQNPPADDQLQVGFTEIIFVDFLRFLVGRKIFWF